MNEKNKDGLTVLGAAMSNPETHGEKALVAEVRRLESHVGGLYELVAAAKFVSLYASVFLTTKLGYESLKRLDKALAPYQGIGDVEQLKFVENKSRSEKCPCGCCHVPDYGACPTFEESASPSMCVYCDHGKLCHERDKHNRYFNTPLHTGDRTRLNEPFPVTPEDADLVLPADKTGAL